MNKITTEQAEQLIKNTRGEIFGVKFLKSDGTVREMTARIGVSKYVKGKGLAFSPSAYDLLTVFCMEANNYRMIRLGNIRRLTVSGKVFKVV